MEKEFEIKASSSEEAILLVKSENNFDEKYDMEVVELTKAKSILGFINTKGLFKVIVKENMTGIIKEKVAKILELMEAELEFSVEKGEKNHYYINLNGKDNGIIIGKKGKTLSSFEYLLNVMIRNVRIEVDVEGFKAKREETLIELSEKLVEKVKTTGKAVKLNPMPPNERKTIHSVINKYPELETYSEGNDPNRYVIIKLKKKEGDKEPEMELTDV